MVEEVKHLADTGYLESRGSDFTCSPMRAEGPPDEMWARNRTANVGINCCDLVVFGD